MRLRWAVSASALAVTVTGCVDDSPQMLPPTPAATVAVAATGPVDPDRLGRLRGHFPAGYEVGPYRGGPSPASVWGMGADLTADPPPCGALAEPGAAAAVGLTGSGDGGIVSVVVAELPAGAALDPVVVAQCPRWSATGRRAFATVDAVDAPAVADADTVAMATAARIAVEAEMTTDSVTRTFAAYTPGHLVFVAVVTDPGSPLPPLPDDFGAALLTEAMATLRG